MSEKIVYAYVVADLLHIGHVTFLENAKSFGDKLIVGVLTDEATMGKKPKPTLSFDERSRIVNALRCVDEVIAQDSYSPLDNIKSLNPDILIESDSHTERAIQDAKKTVASYGGQVIVLPYNKGQSSTKIKEAIRNNEGQE